MIESAIKHRCRYCGQHFHESDSCFHHEYFCPDKDKNPYEYQTRYDIFLCGAGFKAAGSMDYLESGMRKDGWELMDIDSDKSEWRRRKS